MRSVAVRLASQGFKVFPLRQDKKLPLIKGWQTVATDDAFKVLETWPGDANPGILCDGLVVLDADVHKGGVASLDRLSLPTTRTHRTPSGGKHKIYRAPPGSQFANRISVRRKDGTYTEVISGAPGIDIKAKGGLIVGAGSKFPDGEYVVECDAPIASLPQHLADLLLAAPQRALDAGKAIVEMDRPEAIEWARTYLTTYAPLAIEGGGGDQTTYNTAERCMDKGVSPETTLDLMAELWNDRCEPPWDYEDLARKVSNAVSYRQDPIGRDSPARVFDTVQMPPGGVPVPAQPAPIVLSVIEAHALLAKPAPERRWLVPNWIPLADVTLLGADGGTGKTTLALQLAQACRTGETWLGLPVIGGPAIYLSAEEPEDELHIRLQMITGGVLDEAGRLALLSLADKDATLARFDRNGELQTTPLFDAFLTFCLECAVRLIVLDAAADVFGGNENERTQVRSFIRLLRAVALKTDSAVLLLSHPSVDGMKTGRGYSGSTHWNNAVRSRLYFSTPTNADGDVLDPDLRCLSLEKANRARRGEKIMLRWQAGQFVVDANAGKESLAEVKALFLMLLEQHTKQGRLVSHTPGPGYAPKTFAADAGAKGYKKQKFEAAMSALFQAGRIRVATCGPPSKIRKYLEVVHLPGF